MRPPPIWTVNGFLSFFQEVHAAEDRRFAFILGAGASLDSGIPMAGQLVGRWLQELHDREDHEDDPLAVWATAANLGIEGFEYQRAVEFYSQVFARRFADHPEEGYTYLERILHGHDPSFGYSVLAQVLASTRHRVVITTNFDNLVADALAIYTDTLPFVCGHESLASFVRINPRRPLVVKIHRDLLLAPKNRADEIAVLPDVLVRSLRDLLGSYTPIVIGYGGNDGSLMGLLRDVLQPGDIPGGIYWCYWAGGGQPGEPILEVIRRHHGALIPIQGFDELMLQLNERLGYQRMDQRIADRANERVREYRKSFERLHRRVYPRPDLPTAEDAELPVALDEEGTPAERVAPPDGLAGAPYVSSPRPVVSATQSPLRTVDSTEPAVHPSSERPLLNPSSPEPVTRSGRGLGLGPVLSSRPNIRPPEQSTDTASTGIHTTGPLVESVVNTAAAAIHTTGPFIGSIIDAATDDIHATGPFIGSPLQQSMQAFVSDDPAAQDWWTRMLNAEREPRPKQRIAAFRAAVTSFPNEPELLLSFGRELALANIPGEARAIYRRLEQMTPGDLQLHVDLAILYIHWGARRSAMEHACDVRRIARAQGPSNEASATVALLAGLLAYLDNADDTLPLRLLRTVLPVTATPLLPLVMLLQRAVKRLSGPGAQLYGRLLDCLRGEAEPITLDAIPRWNDITPLTSDASRDSIPEMWDL